MISTVLFKCATCSLAVCTLPRVSFLRMELLPYTELAKYHVQDIFDIHKA